MRLFAAVPIASPARDAIADLLSQLRQLDLPVRWVSDEVLHLTLKFFGEVAPERLDVIEEAIGFAVQGTGALPLQLTEVGAFPSPQRPRVLWIGLTAPPPLEALRDRLEQKCEAIGFPPEGTPFTPHITLGRVREGQRIPSEALEQLLGSVPPTSCVADQVVLYESLLTRAGPRYTARRVLTLSGAY